MRLLLDTHSFLWFINGDSNLSVAARQLIEDTENEKLLSIASLWEMSIKASIGRLKLDFTFPDIVIDHVEGNAMALLPVRPGHLEVLRSLPFHHKDPFDRLIIAQSLSEDMTVLGRDAAFDAYSENGVRTTW